MLAGEGGQVPEGNAVLGVARLGGFRSVGTVPVRLTLPAPVRLRRPPAELRLRAGMTVARHDGPRGRAPVRPTARSAQYPRTPDEYLWQPNALSVTEDRSMRRLLVFLAAAACLSPAPARAELPPLIPRKVLFGNPVKANPQLSPDGK